jgi:hypothetical protein
VLLLLLLLLLGYGMAWLAEEEEGWRRRATHYTLPIMYGTGAKVIDRQRERERCKAAAAGLDLSNSTVVCMAVLARLATRSQLQIQLILT